MKISDIDLLRLLMLHFLGGEFSIPEGFEKSLYISLIQEMDGANLVSAICEYDPPDFQPAVRRIFGLTRFGMLLAERLGTRDLYRKLLYRLSGQPEIISLDKIYQLTKELDRGSALPPKSTN